MERIGFKSLSCVEIIKAPGQSLNFHYNLGGAGCLPTKGHRYVKGRCVYNVLVNTC